MPWTKTIPRLIRRRRTRNKEMAMRLKMTRTRWILLIVVLALLGGLAGLGVLLKHEPGFYRRAAVPPGPERKTLSAACLGRFTQLLNCLNDGYGKWDIKMSQG